MLEIAEFIVQVLIAVGMVGAVVVALFKENLRLKFAPPQLSMKILDQGGHKTTVPLTHTRENGEKISRPESARYYHLKVENQRRWSTANQVQVFLTRIDTPGPDDNLRVLWVGEIPMRWRFQDSYPVARTIGPPAECDLCSIVKDKWLQLETLIRPHELHDQWREKCHLILHFQARSVEVDSDELRVKLAWDFEWEEGDAEMKNHMIVEDVT